MIAEAVAVEVVALVFVDSLLPPPAGRLLLGPPAFTNQLRAMATDGVLAPWSRWFGADAMRVSVPDERRTRDSATASRWDCLVIVI